MKDVFNITEVNEKKPPLLNKAMELAKQRDVNPKEYDKPIAMYVNDATNKMSGSPLEGNHGHWDGDRGNSKWVPDKNHTPSLKNDSGYNNPNNDTMGELLNKHNIDGIDFKNGEPNFETISKGNVELDSFDKRSTNFRNADIELAKEKGCKPEDVKQWRQDNGYTWHECKDMKTMQKVPHEIHANIPHSGGISESKKG